MEVLPMYDLDTGKKKSGRVRAVVRLLMRLLLRWKSLPITTKVIFIALLVLSMTTAAIYTHSTFVSSKGSSEEWRRQLGRAAWHFLHTTAAQLPDKENITATHLEAFRSIFRSLEVIYPCEECREHLVQNMRHMRSLDTVVDAPSALVWTCELHNIVNVAQHKPVFPCDPDALAKKWSNPNCGCRSKKIGDAAPPVHAGSPARAADAGKSSVSQPTQAPIQAEAPKPKPKADAILKAQAKIAADTAAAAAAAAAKSEPIPPPVAAQDAAAAAAEDAQLDNVPDVVSLPDGEVEVSGD